MGYTRKGPRGAQRFRWNATTKTLEASWLYTERSMAWTLSPVSITDQTVYLNTLQDGVMTIIGLDWEERAAGHLDPAPPHLQGQHRRPIHRPAHRREPHRQRQLRAQPHRRTLTRCQTWRSSSS